MFDLKAPRTHPLGLALGYNICQSLILLILPGDGNNYLFSAAVIIPILYVSYQASQLNRIAYCLLLYWYFLQAILIQIPGASMVWTFGLKFKFWFLEDQVGIDPLAVVLFFVVLFEIDKVFTKLADNPIRAVGASTSATATNSKTHDTEVAA